MEQYIPYMLAGFIVALLVNAAALIYVLIYILKSTDSPH